MIWNPLAEQADQKEREKLQLKNLQFLVRRVYDKVPFYHAKFDKAGIKPEK